MLFMVGDLVNYVGEKLRQELRGKVGEVHAKVKNASEECVVDFDTGDSYVIHESNLAHSNRSVSKEDTSVHSHLRRKRIEADADTK
jgi:hypothetical protein